MLKKYKLARPVTASIVACLVLTLGVSAPLATHVATMAKVAAIAPMTRKVDCDTAKPPPLRVVYGPGYGATQCFGGTGVESIGSYVQGIATTGHSGTVLISQGKQCVAIFFRPNNFLRIDEVVCAIEITSES